MGCDPIHLVDAMINAIKLNLLMTELAFDFLPHFGLLLQFML
jgi:hypothetical protein